MSKFHGSTRLKAAAKALERAAGALADFESTSPFQDRSDPRKAEAEAGIKTAEGLISEVRENLRD